MTYRERIFKDRAEAGRLLALALTPYRKERPIILGLPRGGVVVAYEVARALEAPLDVVVARKLGAPFAPELAIGAIAPGGVVLLQARFGMTDPELRALIARETAEMERRIRRYRGGDGLPDIEGRTVILVDDGLATGLTAEAAIQAIRKQETKRIVLAVPVSAAETAAYIREEVDDFVCLSLPEEFFALGEWYVDFAPVSDEEVVRLLGEARKREQQQAAAPVAEDQPE